MSRYCDCKSSACKPICRNQNEGSNIGDSIEIPSRLSFENLTIDDESCGKGYCGLPSLKGEGDCGPKKNYYNVIPDKLIFVLEWYEDGSELIKKYLLIYYGIDGTCEIKDMINKQRFLRRLKLDTVELCRLYIGNIINIYGRQMTITEYADSCTQQYIEPRAQRAFLLIKPDAVQCLGRILQELEKSFKILRARMSRITTNLASYMCDPYKAQDFYPRMLQHLTSGPVVAILLVGENAIQNLQCLVGDTDPGIAKLKHPSTLRAIYGKDIVMNGFHVSESPACVLKDSSVFFTDCRKLLPTLAPGTALMQCSTCCIIKPHAVKEGLSGKIISDITTANYKITALELFYLDRSHADEFYEIYKGVLPEYSTMTAELSLGPCFVMEISDCGRETPCSFREFTGPMNPGLARKVRPESLRAKYGRTNVQNAVHCTDLEDDAEMEIDYFFRILQM